MNSRGLTFLLGLVAGLAVAVTWSLLTHSIVVAAQTSSTSSLPKIKEDPAFKAEWDKLRTSDPKAFEKRKAQFTVIAQMDLAEFGYGTMFTGDLDDRTKEGLKAYQAYRGLPVTGDIDPLTVDQLQADDEFFHQQELFLSPFQFFDAAWDDGGLTTSGSWVEEGKSDPEIESSNIECYRDWGMCIDGQAQQTKLFGSTDVIGKFEAYKITTWDKYELIADSLYPMPCERDTLRINRQEKSVTVVSIPAYQNEKTCQDALGKAKTVNYHLLDGKTIAEPRNEKRKAALGYLLKFSDKARSIMYSPSGG